MADSFAVQVMEILEEYNQKVDSAMQKVLPDVAKEAAKQIKGGAPSRTGAYSRGWRAKITMGAIGVEAVVYNASKAGLPHLLENGHAKRNGGRSSAYEHIKPVEEWVKTETLSRLEDELR